MKSMIRVLLVLLAVPAFADSVWLHNGNRLEGQAATLPNGDVEISSAAGTLRLPGSIVARVETGQSAEAAAKAELAQLVPEDVAGRFDLAIRLESAGASTLSRAVLREVLRIAPEHREARRRLGEIDCDGDWLSPDECHATRGEVYYRGRWIGSSEWARLEALENQRRSAEADRRRQEVRLEAAMLQAQQVQQQSYGSQLHPHYWGAGGYVVVPPPAGTPAVPPVVQPPRPSPTSPSVVAPQSRSNTFRAADRPFRAADRPYR